MDHGDANWPAHACITDDEVEETVRAAYFKVNPAYRVWYGKSDSLDAFSERLSESMVETRSELNASLSASRSAFKRRLRFLLFGFWTDMEESAELQTDVTFLRMFRSIVSEMERHPMTHLVVMEFFRQLSINAEVIHRCKFLFFHNAVFSEADIGWNVTSVQLRLVEVWADVLSYADEWIRAPSRLTDDMLHNVSFPVMGRKRKR